MMNYELLILNNAIRMKKSVNIFTKELELIAMRSYDTTYWRDGTMGQIRAIADLSKKIDECNAFCAAVKKALLIVPKTYRALLVAVYFKHVDKRQLALKYNVSVSTVYRKIFRAREAFKRALQSIGCDEKWLMDNYGEYNFVNEK